MKTSPRGLALIEKFEGFRTHAYRDVVGVWTIGYGFTKDVQPGDTMTKAQADVRLRNELVEYEDAVADAAGECNQNQFDALVCFAWNVGVGGMRKSTVIKCHRRGEHEAAARAFGLWTKAGGKVWPGLVRRRTAEASLYLEPTDDDEVAPVEGPVQEMPQAITPERSMVKSEIAVAGTITTVGSTVSVISQISKDTSQIGENLGAALPYVILIAAVAAAIAGGWVVINRLKQRRDGWV